MELIISEALGGQTVGKAIVILAQMMTRTPSAMIRVPRLSTTTDIQQLYQPRGNLSKLLLNRFRPTCSDRRVSAMRLYRESKRQAGQIRILPQPLLILLHEPMTFEL